MKTTRPVALITGVSRGIGKAIAVAISKEGFDIAGVSRTIGSSETKDEYADLELSVKRNGAEFSTFRLDIGNIPGHEEILNLIMNRFGRIDLLVNNAGVAPLKRMDMLETTIESYDRVMGVNLRGPLFFTQKVVNIMLETRDRIPGYSPAIIFITSISAERSSTNRIEYCISKAGLSMASQGFADRLAKSGIRIFEIRPGIIETDMTAKVKEKYDKLIAEGLIPQERWGQPEDIAKAVVSICKGHFDYSTGMIFEVSGGMNIRSL